jgi:hypothetical protein
LEDGRSFVPFEIGRFTLTTNRMVLIGCGAVLVIAVVVILAVVLSRSPADSDGEELVPSSFYPWATADRLFVPNELERRVEPSWVLSREPHSRWSPDEVARWWFDPTAIGVDVLQRRVEQRVEALLSEVP